MKIIILLVFLIFNVEGKEDKTIERLALKYSLTLKSNYSLSSVQKFNNSIEILYSNAENYKVITLNSLGIYVKSPITKKTFIQCSESKDKCMDKYGISFLLLNDKQESFLMDDEIDVILFSLEDHTYNAYLFKSNILIGGVFFTSLTQKGKIPKEFKKTEVISFLKTLQLNKRKVSIKKAMREFEELYKEKKYILASERIIAALVAQPESKNVVSKAKKFFREMFNLKLIALPFNEVLIP